MQKHHIPAIEQSSGFEQTPWLSGFMWTKREHLQAEKYKIATKLEASDKILLVSLSNRLNWTLEGLREPQKQCFF
jgi:hypothetical protein